MRLGALDKAGGEAVGGVVVARYGSNPLEVIKNVKKKIEEISPGLPAKTLADGTVSKVTIVPFYDRTGLIYETLGTLNDAIYQEILVTVIVIVIMVMHLRSSVMISSVMPLAVLGCFIAMKTFGVDANIVSLSGIAIAIGTIVDMGIVICENILRHLDEDPADMPRAEVIHRAAAEVGSASVVGVRIDDNQLSADIFYGGPGRQAFQAAGIYQDVCAFCLYRDCVDYHPARGSYPFLPTQGSGIKYARIVLYGLLAAVGLAICFMFSWLAGLAIIGFCGVLSFQGQDSRSEFRRRAIWPATLLFWCLWQYC